MALPSGRGPWPPKSLDTVLPKLTEWGAWYGGDPTELRNVYQRGQSAPVDKVAQYRGGVAGTLARMWWGRPLGDLTTRHDQLHVPIAADLCQTSADLLFSEPVAIAVKENDTKTQDRIDLLCGEGLHTLLAESAEIAAALGGVYLRVTWDQASSDTPFLTCIHADAAVPEFRWNQLVAVTFWRVLAMDGQRILRHLERHETNAEGVGIILHGLYWGTVDTLGDIAPLTEHPSTAGLAFTVDAESSISTESPGLAVVYVPNQRPQRRWRTDAVGASLGRSDLDGIESMMDALDEVYSSWMRDVRLAKARLVVPEYMLANLGIGRGAAFDSDREIYSTLSMPPADNNEKQITAQQFDIRCEEHKATADELVATILRTVGYSAQTFGEAADGSAMTATEIQSKERRSYMTRDRKIRLFRPAITNIIEKLLAVDVAIFKSGVTVQRPDVAFSDGVQADPEALARTATLLRTAQAASTATLVGMQHPEWDEETTATEVAQILAESGLAVPNPATETNF